MIKNSFVILRTIVHLIAFAFCQAILHAETTPVMLKEGKRPPYPEELINFGEDDVFFNPQRIVATTVKRFS